MSSASAPGAARPAGPPVSSSPAFMKASSAQQRLPQGQEVCSSQPCTDSPHVCLNSGPSSNPPSELRTGLAPVDTGLQWAGQGQDHGIKLQRKLEARGADVTNLREKLNSECQTLHVSRERRGRGQTERPSPGWLPSSAWTWPQDRRRSTASSTLDSGPRPRRNRSGGRSAGPRSATAGLRVQQVVERRAFLVFFVCFSQLS